ncbi:hypothetical protein [Hyphomicrobium sp.]|uniref:hypothetical protein n=1 Tax=Hyphomicrobium sp. TaxID=82 RepID=UPI001E1779B9|nr:hypothetical protein [Hyphomicrobium sp.]MBY0559993.1 hypothetical protein [Hyphomicrobium sp.]
MEQLEALKLVRAMAQQYMLKADDYSSLGVEAVAEVTKLIKETEEAAEDPIKHGLDFLETHGLFVYGTLHSESVIDNADFLVADDHPLHAIDEKQKAALIPAIMELCNVKGDLIDLDIVYGEFRDMVTEQLIKNMDDGVLKV